MKNSVKQKWQSFVKFAQAYETESSYPFAQVRELQLEVARLKADGPVCDVCTPERQG